METTFWVGLVLGAILSLAASIVANIYNDKIQDRLEHFKLTRHGKRRDKALVEYRLLRHLRSETRDKQAFISLQLTRIVTLYVICLIVFTTVPVVNFEVVPVSVRVWTMTFGLLLGTSMFLFAFIVAQRFMDELQKLYKYDSYEAAALSRWEIH